MASAGLGVFLQGLGMDTLLLPKKCCSDGDYLIRQEMDEPAIGNYLIVLLKNEGIIEKQIEIYCYPKADSIKVVEDKGAVAIYCNEIEPFWCNSKRCLEPLNNMKAKKNEIEKLAKDLKVDINYETFHF